MKASYITPAVTAFDAEGHLDLEAQGALFDYLIEGGVDGILILGSIGEFFAVSLADKRRLIDFAVERIGHRTSLLVGTASMALDEVVSLSNYALRAGADSAIVVPPYYFSFAGRSVEAYYDRLAPQVEGPLMLYNFPDRTGYEIPVDVTLNLLRRHKNLVGYKDTVGSFEHTRALIQAVKPEFPDFRIYSGFDDSFARNLLAGGDGCIAGLSNLLPGLCSGWARAFERGDLGEVARVQRLVDRLMALYQVGTPFVPYIKRALQLAGLPIRPVSSFPMPEPSEAEVARLTQLLQEAGVL